MTFVIDLYLCAQIMYDQEQVFFVAQKQLIFQRQPMKTQKPLKTRELKAAQNKLLEKTGYILKPYLIEQAFTRSSYSKQYGGGSNENFEFIGDTILGYHVVRQLYDHYGTIHSDEEGFYYSFRAHENDFTNLKAKIVSNQTLADIIDEWDLCQYLIVGKSDIKNEVDKQEKIKADLFEAIIGAYAVQYKWDQEILNNIITKCLPIEQYILDYEKAQYRPPEFSPENAITALKELGEHEECSVPQYDIAGPDSLGYSKDGNPIWCCHCMIQNRGIIKSVFAFSKKDAKKYSSYLALCDLFELPNVYGSSKSIPYWLFDGKKLIPNPKSSF